MAKGRHTGGRPKKPDLTDEEFNIATEILQAGLESSEQGAGATGPVWRARGYGWRAARLALNQHRAKGLVDPEAIQARQISVRWLQRAMAKRRHRGQTPTVAKPMAGQEGADRGSSPVVVE